MKKNNKISLLNLILGTWFFSGKIPIASGTWGSLLALPFAYYIVSYFGMLGLLFSSIVITLIGLKVTSCIIKESDNKDPSMIVIDEVAGQWFSLLFVGTNLVGFVFAFVLFRFFDILKPYPACWADKKLGGSLGVMLDDVFAGFYVCICVLLMQKFYPEFFQIDIVNLLTVGF